MSKEKQIEIKVITCEEQRLKYFSDLLKKAQARYKRLVRKHKDAHYLSDEFQKMCDVSGEICFLEEVVDMLEYGYRKQSENVIELPCRVGDTMYVKYKGIAYPVKVNAIRIDTKKNNHRICVSGTFHLYEYYDHNYKATFPFDSIGKSLFYTEAEAKMKGGAE